MTVARNRLRDMLGSAAVRTAAPLDDHLAATTTEPTIRHTREAAGTALRLCAPAIDAAVRTPLMLQVVLGFDAARSPRCSR